MSERVHGYMMAEIELCNAATDEIGSMRMLRQLVGIIAVADRLEWPFGEKPAVANPSPPRFLIQESLLDQVQCKLDQLMPVDIVKLWTAIAE